MNGNSNLFGIRGFLIDAPDFGTLRGRRNGAIIIEGNRILAAGGLRRPAPDAVIRSR